MIREQLITLVFAIVACVQGDVVLVGGGLADNNAFVYDRIVELAGGKGVARIGIICTASATPEDSGVFYENLFKTTYGAAEATYIPVTETSNNADTQQIADLVRAQTGLFFGGGDQARIIKAWRKSDNSDSLGLSAVREVAARGVVGGTSAGAACQGSGPMLEGGLSYNGLMYGAYPGGYNPQYPDDLCYNENGGLGLVDKYVVDTHYSQRGREGRLIQLLLDTQSTNRWTQLAIAVDENTGVHIKLDGTSEVLGNEGGAMIVDVVGASYISKPHTITKGVQVSFFTENDQFNIYTGAVTFASWKSSMKGNEFYLTATSSDNIFSSPNKLIREYNVFRDVAHRLWDSKEFSVTSYSFEKGPQFDLTMMKTGALAFGGYSPTTNAFTVSYQKMSVDIGYTL